MLISPTAIKNVLSKNRNLLAGAVEGLRAPTPDLCGVTLNIEKAMSSLETMESLLDAKKLEEDAGVRMKIPPLMPASAGDGKAGTLFVDETQDDNPEQEDADAKKAREESRSFFG